MSVAGDRIGRAFEAARQQRRPLVVPFVTAGFPRATSTVPLVHGLCEAGFGGNVGEARVFQVGRRRGDGGHRGARFIANHVEHGLVANGALFRR